MPTPRLTASALYLVPALTEQLEVLGFAPTAPGYSELRQKHLQGFRQTAGNGANQPPSIKTIQKMMYNEEPVKYGTCSDLLKLLNIERRVNSLVALNGSSIEEREFAIPELQKALQSIATRNQLKWPGPGSAILVAERAEVSRGLVVAMSKGILTTHTRCEVVLSAVQQLVGGEGTKILKSLRITAGHPHIPPRAITAQLELEFDVSDQEE